MEQSSLWQQNSMFSQKQVGVLVLRLEGWSLRNVI